MILYNITLFATSEFIKYIMVVVVFAIKGVKHFLVFSTIQLQKLLEEQSENTASQGNGNDQGCVLPNSIDK